MFPVQDTSCATWLNPIPYPGKPTRLLAIAVLISLLVLTTGGFPQDNSSSTEPSSAPAPANSASAPQAPPSTSLGSGRAAGEKKLRTALKRPRPIKNPDPEYSKEAKKRKIEGTVVLMVIVGADGLPRDIRVTRSLGHGRDEEAIKAVKKWKFKPGTVQGRAVPVQINVVANFRLY